MAIATATGDNRVLAIDASAGSGLAAALGVPDAEPGEITPVPGQPGLSVLPLTTEAAIDEYVRMTLRTPIAPRLLAPVARIFDYVAVAAPAVREILTIGKIGHEVRRQGWDRVIVDGPATGHVVELLASPDNLAAIVGSSGPLADETTWLRALLSDPAQAGAVVVSLPEELPVNESVELIERLRSDTPVAVSAVIVNRMPPAVSDDGRAEAEALAATESPLGAVAAIAVTRRDRAEADIEALDALDLPRLVIPDDPDNPVGVVVEALTGADR